MQILNNTLRIEFVNNPEQIIQLIINGWLVREGLTGTCQAITEPGQVFLRFKAVRHSAESLKSMLETLNELILCTHERTRAKLRGYIDFGSSRELWRVSAAEWAHGKFVIEWDHAVRWDDEDDEEDDEAGDDD